MKYKVADNVFEIVFLKPCAAWETLKSHFDPFVTDDSATGLTIEIDCGPIDESKRAGMAVIHKEESEAEGLPGLAIYASDTADPQRAYLFEITQHGEPQPNATLYINADRTLAKASLCDEHSSAWHMISSLTTVLQLSYMIANNHRRTILTHASCILRDGHTYLFLGKSGTGKSTHSRLWLKNVPGSTLLNDDHPILRINDAGDVIAYGSPWSGKTHCYRNLQAPVGAIVRIKRAPYDAITRLNPITAYASLITAFSGLTIDDIQADDRHRTIEQIVAKVPCYQLECLPDDEAAIVCSTEVCR